VVQGPGSGGGGRTRLRRARSSGETLARFEAGWWVAAEMRKMNNEQINRVFYLPPPPLTKHSNVELIDFFISIYDLC
jgi:hypothetical protein